MNGYDLRPEEMKSLLRALEHQSVLLLGPRRIGKTTLLQQLESGAHTTSRAVYIDLEALRDVPSAIATMGRRLTEAGLLTRDSAVQTHLARIEEVSLQVAGTGGGLRRANVPALDPWQSLDDALASAIKALPETQRLVLLFDEVPWWLDALRETSGDLEVRTTLAALRGLRHGPLRDRLRMILTGSVGLEPLAKACGAVRDLNDLHRETVPPLSQVAGQTLFELLLDGRAVTSEATRHAWWLAGGSPHWIQRLATLIPVAGAVQQGHVEAAAEQLLRPQLRGELADLARDEFVRRYAPEVANRFTTILAAAAADERGLPFEGLLAIALSQNPGLTRVAAEELVWTLQDGWLLVVDEADGRPLNVRFQTPLHARWWQRYGDSR